MRGEGKLLSLPPIGLGTWKSRGDDVKQAVLESLRLGYRLVDCAEAYGNESLVGAALAEAFDAGLVRREELQVVSKLFNNYHGRERVPLSLKKSLADLGLDYLDLYLMHWPIAFEDIELPSPARGDDGTPHPQIRGRIEFVETWQAMAEMKASGRVRHIGVCNFTVPQLEELIAGTGEVPCVNQVELHPFLYQRELLEYCSSQGIAVMAYSPLGSPDSYSGKLAGPILLENPIVAQVAADMGCTPAQALIRWGALKGACVLAKSVRPERLKLNLDAVSLAMTPAQEQALDALHRDYRFGLGWLPGHFLPTT